MNILMLVVETAPFTHVGGLARGTYALAKALFRKGHDVRIMTPMHHGVSQCIQRKSTDLKNEKTLSILLTPNGGKNKNEVHASVLSLNRSEENELTYFVDYPDYFSLRSQVYGYVDDYKRYYFFSQVCLEWLLFLQRGERVWLPEVIQCHDWHTGYFVDLLKNNRRYRSIKNIPIVFTVHNFKYQNETKFQYMDEQKVDMGEDPLADIDSSRLQEQNALCRGMLFANRVNTVSPTHAREITLSEYSYNLQKVICKIEHKLSGILNGLDYEEFNPSNDTQIKYKYSDKSVWVKRLKNKQQLRWIFSLPDNGESPVFSYVGRMTSQKGLELLFEAMGRILKESSDIQLIGVGDGEDHYCELFWRFKKEFPNQVGIKLVHDINLPRQIFAGTDITLVPSNFEPGGIVVLEALRYGSVPIVRRTGGLNDIITDFSATHRSGNGFSFREKDPNLFYEKIIQALELYKNNPLWNSLVQNCMLYKRTWENACVEYEQLFQKTIIKSH